MFKHIIKGLLYLTFMWSFLLPASAENSAGTPPDITADSAIVINADTGTVYYEKNADKREYPASMTKVMTLLLSLEKNHPGHIVSVSHHAADVESTSLYTGEWIAVDQLNYLMMLRSDNGAATALGEYIGGNIPGFAQMMNDKAHALGATNTHFVNANGMPDENHYSTARDMSVIVRYGMSLPAFRKIVSTKSCGITFTRPQTTRLLYNTNKLLFTYDGAIGGKTGWTKAAKGCLASAATRNNITLIAIVMHSATAESRFTESVALLDYGFAKAQSEAQNDRNNTICSGRRKIKAA